MQNDAEDEVFSRLEREKADDEDEKNAKELGHVEHEEVVDDADADADVEAEDLDLLELDVIDDDVELQPFFDLDHLIADVGRVDAVLAETIAELNANAAELREARAVLEDAVRHSADADAAVLVLHLDAVDDLVEERGRVVRVAAWLVLVRALAVPNTRIQLLPAVGLAIIVAQGIVRVASGGAVVVGAATYARITMLLLFWLFGY